LITKSFNEIFLGGASLVFEDSNTAFSSARSLQSKEEIKSTNVAISLPAANKEI
jgi:hypothetical protein